MNCGTYVIIKQLHSKDRLWQSLMKSIEYFPIHMEYCLEVNKHSFTGTLFMK